MSVFLDISLWLYFKDLLYDEDTRVVIWMRFLEIRPLRKDNGDARAHEDGDDLC